MIPVDMETAVVTWSLEEIDGTSRFEVGFDLGAGYIHVEIEINEHNISKKERYYVEYTRYS